MPNEIDHASSDETKEHLAYLLTKPALRNLPLSKTETELREWLSLLVEFFQTSENIDPNFLEETLETLRICIEKSLNKHARSCSEAPSRAEGSFDVLGLRASEFLLMSLDLIVKVTLEKSRNDENVSGLASDITEGLQVSKKIEQHGGTVRSTASSALKALSGWFASSERNRSPASVEHGERSCIRVLMRSSPIWLRTVSDAYRTYSILYRRCKSIVEGLLVRNLAEYIMALGVASVEISGRAVFASEDALQFLRSAIKLSTDSERVTLPAFFTAVGFVGDAIALQQNRLLRSSTSRGRYSHLSERQHTDISLPRAGVALLTSSGMKGTSTHGHSSKSRGVESTQLGEETREQRRLLSRFFSMSDEELRHHLGGLHSHVLAVSFLWTSVMITKDCASDEALASFRALIDTSIMHYVEPACPLILLRTVYKFVELSASERTTFPLEFLERIRAVVETVVGIAGEDWHLPSPSDTGQTVPEPDTRLAFSILALEGLAEYVSPLIEIIFREDRTMRKKMLCAVCDVALRALKANSSDDEDDSSRVIAKEVLASFGTYDGTIEVLSGVSSEHLDLHITADSKQGWKCESQVDLRFGYAAKAAQLIYKILEPAIHDEEDETSMSNDGAIRAKWRVRDLQDRLLVALEDENFFRCKNRYVLRFLGPCFCAIFRHNDTLQISSIGEISARSQGQAVTPSTLFQARDISADETRSLRRIAFTLFHSRIGEFGASIRALLRRIEADWRKNDAAISAACFLLLRVIILRVPPEHIIGSRALILSETMRILRIAAGEPYAAFAAIKFVDQLLLLNLPEFSYAQPLFFASISNARNQPESSIPPADTFSKTGESADGVHHNRGRLLLRDQTHMTAQHSRLQPQPILLELAEEVHDLGDALPPVGGMPIRINPRRFMSSKQRRASADTNEIRLVAKSASSTETLRALRSYARALCLRCSDAAVAYSPPCVMAIEQWVESEFLSAAELWKELGPR